MANDRVALLGALRDTVENGDPLPRERMVALNLRLLSPLPAELDERIEGVSVGASRVPADVDLPTLLAGIVDLMEGVALTRREQVAMVNMSKEYAHVQRSTVELVWQVVA